MYPQPVTFLSQPPAAVAPQDLPKVPVVNPRLVPPVAAPRDLTAWTSPTGTYVPIKRALDVVVSLVLIVLTAPVVLVAMTLTAFLYRQPMLYCQLRAGYRNEPFAIFKICTMGPNSDGTVVVFGKFASLLRKTSIDELPQLINVLRGDMSLIGPRPEVWGKAVKSGLLPHPRLNVRPGITGLWQISEARMDEIENGLEYDQAYLAEFGPVADVRVAVGTLLAVVKSHTD